MSKQTLLSVFSSFIFIISACSFTDIDSSNRDRILVDTVSYLLKEAHYNPMAIDDSFSEKVFDKYINLLDPFKRNLYKSDIKYLEKYKYQIDNQIEEHNLLFFEEAYKIYSKRFAETEKIIDEVLSKPFNFSKKESIQTNYEKMMSPNNRSELFKRWRKQMKMATLANLQEKIEIQKSDKKNNEEDFTEKSVKELESEARESTLKNITESYDIMNSLEREDWFYIYVNTLAEVFDPHTTYFSPDDKTSFNESISGKFEGIGAQLRKRSEGILITKVIYGGPAWKQKKLEPGDMILKVAQKGEEAVSVSSMKLSNTIKLIKGPKGTIVSLTLKRTNGTIEIVNIIRGVVELEETYLKSALIKRNDKTFAVINLPTFYIDFKGDYSTVKNAASDMRKEINRLQKLNVNGIILDLRNNGGGSLKTVVDITGFFISEGPVVQVKSTKHKEILKDNDSTVDWEKPIVILVNEFSASASEILAAAIQDYNRGIIIGSKHTFGKGTVQNVIDLNEILKNKSDIGDLGALKITTQKFYRINGGSTQLEGVKSDIIIPDKFSNLKLGEREMDNAMSWDKISPVKYKRYNNNFKIIKQKSKTRISKNKLFKLIEKNARYLQKEQNKSERTLNFDEFSDRNKEIKTFTEQFDTLNNYYNQLKIVSLPYETALMEKDSALFHKRKDWHTNLKKDLYIEEAIYVLEDILSDPKNIALKSEK